MGDWETLDEPWRVAFSQAWESFAEGSVPVGAVLCDESGAIFSIGRNRWFGTEALPRQISGSSIAHAEINALATLPFGYYPRHVLYTTVEPCWLCTAAVGLSHIGSVRFALEDPMWYGMEQLKDVNHHLARFDFHRDGPLAGPMAGLVEPALPRHRNRAWRPLRPVPDRRPAGAGAAAARQRGAQPAARFGVQRRPNGTLATTRPRTPERYIDYRNSCTITVRRHGNRQHRHLRRPIA